MLNLEALSHIKHGAQRLRRAIAHIQGKSIESLSDEYRDRFEALVAQATAGTLTQAQLSAALQDLIEEYAELIVDEAEADGDQELDEDEREEIIALWLAGQTEALPGFVEALLEADSPEAQRAIVDNRVPLWVTGLVSLGWRAHARTIPDRIGVWELGATEVHCTTCAGLAGQEHPVSWYEANGYYPGEPGSLSLECKGYHCDCQVTDVKTGERLL